MEYVDRNLSIIGALKIASLMAMPAFGADPVLLKDIGLNRDLLEVEGATQTHLFFSTDKTYAFDSTSQSGTEVLPRVLDGEFIALGPIAIFSYSDDSHGRELWRSDGTLAGTYLLQDLVGGTESSNPQTFVQWRGKVYFTTAPQFEWRDPANARLPQLWSTDGTVEGTQLVTDIDALMWFGDGEELRASMGRIRQLVAGQDKLFFSMELSDSDTEFYADFMWQSDGTAQGTAKMVNPDNNLPVFASKLLQSVGDITFFADNHPYWS